MRYLILSDLHSNLEALEEALRLAEGKFDQALCLGDLVGYGPDPNAVVDRIRQVAAVIIRGNHDKACCGLMDPSDFNALARIATDWTREQLTPEHVEYLRNLAQGPVAMRGFELVHGSPADEDEYILSPTEAVPVLRRMTLPLVFFGHTHYQGGFILTSASRFQSIACGPIEDRQMKSLPLAEGGRYLINPGSPGQPRDGDWRAGFCIFDQDQMLAEFYRAPYEIGKTQAKMRAAGLPEPLVRRLEIGR